MVEVRGFEPRSCNVFKSEDIRAFVVRLWAGFAHASATKNIPFTADNIDESDMYVVEEFVYKGQTTCVSALLPSGTLMVKLVLQISPFCGSRSSVIPKSRVAYLGKVTALSASAPRLPEKTDVINRLRLYLSARVLLMPVPFPCEVG